MKILILFFAVSLASIANANIQLDQYIGNYQAKTATRPGEKLYGAFFKEPVFIKSQNMTVDRYTFALSDTKLDFSQIDVRSIERAFQIYVDSGGRFYQFWAYERHIDPMDTDFIDLYAKDNVCGWRPSKVGSDFVDMDYCGDSAPRDVFTFSSLTIRLTQYDRYALRILTEVIADQEFVLIPAGR